MMTETLGFGRDILSASLHPRELSKEFGAARLQQVQIEGPVEVVRQKFGRLPPLARFDQKGQVIQAMVCRDKETSVVEFVESIVPEIIVRPLGKADFQLQLSQSEADRRSPRRRMTEFRVDHGRHPYPQRPGPFEVFLFIPPYEAFELDVAQAVIAFARDQGAVERIDRAPQQPIGVSTCESLLGQSQTLTRDAKAEYQLLRTFFVRYQRVAKHQIASAYRFDQCREAAFGWCSVVVHKPRRVETLTKRFRQSEMKSTGAPCILGKPE